jgi:hypothetical protein
VEQTGDVRETPLSIERVDLFGRQIELGEEALFSFVLPEIDRRPNCLERERKRDFEAVNAPLEVAPRETLE